jgi:hypothetical protein
MGEAFPCNFFALKSVLILEGFSVTLITDFSIEKERLQYE